MGLYRDYKNGINNSRNFQIQSLSSSIVNKAMILINRQLKEKGIDAWVCGTVHDQIITNCPESDKLEVRQLVKNTMENSTKLSVQLKAPPEIGTNWRDSH